MTARLDRVPSADELDVGLAARPVLGGRRGLVVLGVLVVVLAVVVTWLVAFSPVLGVKTVRVTGERITTESEILTAADISRGTPLLRLDTAAVRRRVEQLPDVAAVRVSTHYPSSVDIAITERVAIGYVAADGHYALVDKTGDQFRTVTDKPQLPLFAVPVGPAARASAAAESAVAAELPMSLLAQIGSIQALDPTAITLLMSNGRVVRWGSPSDSALKASVLPTLLAEPGNTIDLTDPLMPFTH